MLAAAGSPAAQLKVSDLQVAVTGAAGTPALAVRGVSLELARGSTLAIVGESGSGKTLTALAIAGLLPTSARVVAGSVSLNGQRLYERASRSRLATDPRIGLIFQNPIESLNPGFTIGAQLRRTLRSSGSVSRAEATSRSIDLLREVSLEPASEIMRRYPNQISGGMRQRASVALAIASAPELLIADEPTTALDPTIQVQVLRLLKKVQRTRNIGMIVITHDISVAAAIADNVLVMYAGSIMEYGPVDAILTHPLHPYTRALLKAMPNVGKSHRLEPIDGSPPDPSFTAPGCPFAPRCRFARSECFVTPQTLEERPDGGLVACMFWRDIAQQ